LNTPTELTIPLQHLKLTARVWGPEDAPPVIACHGWLDNAASFDHLAPLLPDCRLVALDLPGHGHSDHRPPGAVYHFLDMVSELFEVADYFGWEKFALLGHSMGAGLSTITAGTFPERITRLLLIEGLGPLAKPAEEAPDILRESVELWQAFPKKRMPQYVSEQVAVVARHAVSDMAESSVHALVQRNLRPEGERFTWRTDPRLKVRSRVYLTEAQVCAFLANLRMPTLLITGKQSVLAEWLDLIHSRIALVSALEHVELNGGHHLHLDNPESVAEAIRQFLFRNPCISEHSPT
jgi:pimeloyl-ACP methyl ester carboxylesterase